MLFKLCHISQCNGPEVCVAECPLRVPGSPIKYVCACGMFWRQRFELSSSRPAATHFCALPFVCALFIVCHFGKAHTPARPKPKKKKKQARWSERTAQRWVTEGGQFASMP